MNYETYICDGCELFCLDPYDYNCHYFENQLDLKYEGIICQEQYFFQDD